MNSGEIQQILEQLQESKGNSILVIGDSMIDQDIFGSTKTNPDFKEVKPMLKETCVENTLGGAANAAANLRNLSNEVHLISLVGDDGGAKIINELAGEQEIHNYNLIDKRRKTTIKKRFYTNAKGFLFRSDSEDDFPIDEESLRGLENLLKRIKPSNLKGILISDYAKGLITNESISIIKAYANQKGVPIIVDPNRKYLLDEYTNVDVIKPNQVEAGVLINLRGLSKEQIAKKLQEEYRSNIVLTWGSQGMYIASQNNQEHIPAIKINGQVYTIGAGDTVASMLTYAYSAGVPLVESARLANCAAAISVRLNRLGQPPLDQIIEEYKRGREQ